MTLMIGMFLLISIAIIKCKKGQCSNKEVKVKLLKNYNLTIKRKLINSDSQKLNNFVEIYNPYNTVGYISSINNQYGDVFIETNSEDGFSDKRVIYAIKSDGTNYYSDIDKSYKIFNISVDENHGWNFYPMITPLIMKNKESLVSLSHQGDFETFDFKINLAFTIQKTKVINMNSEINRNTFIHLKNYNYTNYILNAFMSKGKKNKFYIQKIFFDRTNITKIKPKLYEEVTIERVLENITISCFEVETLIECLYASTNYYYILSIFNSFNLTQMYYNTTFDNNELTSVYIFSKGIYIRDYISVFIYYLGDNRSPKVVFKKLNCQDSSSYDYNLVNYLEPIIINSDSHFDLNNYYLYNQIIKMDDNNIIYVSSNENSEIIIIVSLKLLNSDKNLLINYYKIELNLYNLKLYKDFTIFNLKDFLGIGMTHYNLSISESVIYSSFFIIGIGSSVNLTIEENKNIFDEDNNFSIGMSSLTSNIYNNIFGYSLKGFRIISSLNESILGFYLFSNENKSKIITNETISLSDNITFKVVKNLCIQKEEYSIIYESIISESSYSDLISLSDSVEYYPSSDTNLEEYYQPRDLYGKKAYFNFNVNYCYKTCQTCSCHGNSINHHCLTCSSEYPYFYNETNITLSINNINNCLTNCPENYVPDNNNICIPYIITTIITTIPTTMVTTIPNEIITTIPTTIMNNPIPTTIINIIPTTIINNNSNNIFGTIPITIINVDTTNILTTILNNNDIVITTDKIAEISNTIIDKETTIVENIVTTFIINNNYLSSSIIGENPLYDNNEFDCYNDINSKIINQLCFPNFQSILINIKEISDYHKIITSTGNSSIYGYKIDENIEEYNINNNLIYINFIDTKSEIFEAFNLDNNSTNIYVLIVDIPNNIGNATNDFCFMLVLENGTELNINKLNKLNNLKINISVPMTNLDSLNYDYATYF